MVSIELSIPSFHATSLMRGEKRERPGIQGVNREVTGGEAGCFIPIRAGFPIVWDRISRAIEAECDDKTVTSPVL
jgi:hypothetical protein